MLEFAPSVSMRVMPGDWIGDSIAMTGVYDLRLSRFVRRFARRGGLMVDVGANVGYFSLLWATAREGNRVIAFEPSPAAAPYIDQNVATNNLTSRIDVRHAAVGNENGELQFDTCIEWGQLGWGHKATAESKSVVTVPAVRLDDALADEPEIAFLKIDIEGLDELAILGAEKLLRAKRIAYLQWEENLDCMKSHGFTPGLAVELVRTCGYQATKIGDNWHASRGDIA